MAKDGDAAAEQAWCLFYAMAQAIRRVGATEI